ncbi:MAG: hypothetical protein ACOYXM_00905 [Actinomycetota bacterium]
MTESGDPVFFTGQVTYPDPGPLCADARDGRWRLVLVLVSAGVVAAMVGAAASLISTRQKPRREGDLARADMVR